MMTQGRRIAVLASGRGSDLQSLLDARQDGRIASSVVVVASDKTGAKALDRAREHGVAAVAVEPDTGLRGAARRQEHEERLIAALEEHAPDVVVLAGYMRLLTPFFVRRYAGRLINVHPALLPSFPGTHGQAQAIKWGVRIAGCTTHFVDEEVDHGPIILQAALAVHPGETDASLSERILEVEHQILPRTVHLFEQDRLRIQGRRVAIDADTSWRDLYPVVEAVLYGPGY